MKSSTESKAGESKAGLKKTKADSIELIKQEYESVLKLANESGESLSDELRSRILTCLKKGKEYLEAANNFNNKDIIRLLDSIIFDISVINNKDQAMSSLKYAFSCCTDTRKINQKFRYFNSYLIGATVGSMIEYESIIQLIISCAPKKLQSLTWAPFFEGSYSFSSYSFGSYSLRTKEGLRISAKFPKEKIDSLLNQYIQNLKGRCDLTANQTDFPTKKETCVGLEIVDIRLKMAKIKKMAEKEFCFEDETPLMASFLTRSWQILKSIRKRYMTALDLEAFTAPLRFNPQFEDLKLIEKNQTEFKKKCDELEALIEKTNFLKNKDTSLFSSIVFSYCVASRLSNFSCPTPLAFMVAFEIAEKFKHTLNPNFTFYFKMLSVPDGRVMNLALIIPTYQRKAYSNKWWNHAITIDPYYIKIKKGKQYFEKECLQLGSNYNNISVAECKEQYLTITLQNALDFHEEVNKLHQLYLNDKKQEAGLQLRRSAVDSQVSLEEFKKVTTKAIEYNQLDSKGTTKTPYTSLHLASLAGETEKVKCLLESKADATLVPNSVFSGNRSVHRYLLEAKADAGVEDPKAISSSIVSLSRTRTFS